MWKRKEKKIDPILEPIQEESDKAVDEFVKAIEPKPKVIPELGKPAATLKCDHCKKDFNVYDFRQKQRRWCFKCVPKGDAAAGNRLLSEHGPRNPRAKKNNTTRIKPRAKSNDLYFEARYENLCIEMNKVMKEHGMVIKEKIARKHIAPYLNKVEEKVKEIVSKTFGQMGLTALETIDWEEEWKAIDKL